MCSSGPRPAQHPASLPSITTAGRLRTPCCFARVAIPSWCISWIWTSWSEPAIFLTISIVSLQVAHPALKISIVCFWAIILSPLQFARFAHAARAQGCQPDRPAIPNRCADKKTQSRIHRCWRFQIEFSEQDENTCRKTRDCGAVAASLTSAECEGSHSHNHERGCDNQQVLCIDKKAQPGRRKKTGVGRPAERTHEFRQERYAYAGENRSGASPGHRSTSSESMLSSMGHSLTGPHPEQRSVSRFRAVLMAFKVRILPSMSAIFACVRARTVVRSRRPSARSERS